MIARTRQVSERDFAGNAWLIISYGAWVGSQQVRKSSLKPSRSSISAGLISKSKTSAFSTMRLGLADLGMTTSPCCSAQRIRICAGDLLFEWRENFPGIDVRDWEFAASPGDVGYLLAMATSFRSLNRSPFVSGL